MTGIAIPRWDRYHQESLIMKIRERPCIWDIRHPDYRNAHKKQALYEEIAAELNQLRPGTTIDDVRKRWANLRCQFSENLRVSRSKPELDKPRKLWCKDLLMFLIDVTVPRTGASKQRRIHQQQQQQLQLQQPPPVQQTVTVTVQNEEILGHENNTMVAQETTSDLDDPDVEDETSRHNNTEYAHCDSNCDANQVTTDSCCFTPVRSSVSSLNVVIDHHNGVKRKAECIDPLCTTSPTPTNTSTTILPSLRPQDAIDKYALCVAAELRQIRQPQQLVLAKWHIQNVLFQAQFGMLSGPPPAMTFTATPSVTSPYTQDTIVAWPQTSPIHVETTDTKEHQHQHENQQTQQQHRTTQDFVRTLSTV